MTTLRGKRCHISAVGYAGNIAEFQRSHFEPSGPSDRPIRVDRCAIRAPASERLRSMSSEHPSGRTAKGFALILGAARAAGLTVPAGDTLVRKAERDELVILAMNDPVMTAAIHRARKTLPQFLALARNPRPTMAGFAVKIAILADNGAEFFWIHPFAHVEERFIGQINNTPRSVMNLKMGNTVAFVRNEIVDWMYMDAGTMKGNYSARAILKSAPPKDRKAFKRRFGLDFDF
jgi:uncharacterized protein YegJ (DUF2314 family)